MQSRLAFGSFLAAGATTLSQDRNYETLCGKRLWFIDAAGTQFASPSISRFKPKAAMREEKVEGFMPSNSAAPRDPEILPFVRLRASMIASRS